MQMHRCWTIYETLFLKRYAGAVPLAMIARDLRRELRDVTEEAARLELATEYRGTPLFWCDECASWSVKLTPSGHCHKCRQRKLNARREAKTAVLLALLPLDVQETYAAASVTRGARKRDPKPLHPDTSNMPLAAAAAAETAYLAALDEWIYRQEFRRGKAVQKRMERIARKVL